MLLEVRYLAGFRQDHSGGVTSELAVERERLGSVSGGLVPAPV